MGDARNVVSRGDGVEARQQQVFMAVASVTGLQVAQAAHQQPGGEQYQQ